MLQTARRRAAALAEADRADEAVGDLRRVLEQFRGAPPGPELVEALTTYADLLSAAGADADAIAAHDRILDLVPAVELEYPRRVEASSRVERARLLEQSDHAADAAEALSAVFARFAGETDDELRRVAAFAGVRAMGLFADLGRRDEAIELAHAVFARFDGSDDPYHVELIRLVAGSLPREGRAMRLVRRARERTVSARGCDPTQHADREYRGSHDS
jgi:tetratricopeptide (TPR) repeat protein